MSPLKRKKLSKIRLELDNLDNSLIKIIKKRTNFLPIDSKMTTSQLWFNLLPVIASLLTVIFSLTNSFLYILETLINS